VPKRLLRQPGPTRSQRFESFEGVGRRLEFLLEPGHNLNEAVAGPLKASGIAAASLVLEGGAFDPLHYLMPALASDGYHAAWYSDIFSPAGETRLSNGNVTFGERDGTPFIHCHASWVEPDGKPGVGHVLPHETIVSQPIRAISWGVEEVRMVSQPDEETAFTLFRPIPSVGASTGKKGPRTVIARVGPNEDVITAVEAICLKHDFTAAILRGGVGSLIGVRYANALPVDDIATEVFVIGGSVVNQTARIEIMAVDTRGTITHGELLRGENPVCITFELCLDEA
jgi:predicted DNA-binding protein with PD1-like motif